MTSKSKARHGIRHSRTFTLNPTTRAIRNALALGLAMATSPVLAGTCDVSVPTNAVCDGAFYGSNISYAIDDLTIVVGGISATDIQPLDGFVGIDLYSANGSISLTSAADIVTMNAAAISVRAPNGDVHVENSGSLQTSYADGIEAISYSGDVTVSNGGSVDVMYGQRGIEARSGNGDITVDNAEGASISVANAYGNATGIDAANYYGDIAITNEGVVDVSVVSYGNATGIRANSFTGNVTVAISDTGSVSATTDNSYGGTAIAVRANSSMGGSLVSNDGDINASATAVYGDATSYGVLNRGGYYGDTSTVNTGTITSTASTGDGVGWAWGIRDRGRTNADIDNSGDINVEADAGTGYATAAGAYVRGMYAHNENSGSITADASVAGIGTARAYGTMTFGYYASLDNSGDISAYSHVGDGVSTAIGAISYYNISFAASNTGSINADAYAGVGLASAMAIRNGGYEQGTIYNGVDGSLIAHGESGDGAAFAYGAWVNAKSSAMTNEGSISADAISHGSNTYGYAIARATGASIQAEDAFDASAVNGQYGDIRASARVYSPGEAYSFGVIAYGQVSGRLDNQGSISAESYADSGLAVSVGSVAAGGFGVTLNSGSISADATVANDGFARAIGAYGQGEVVTIVNDGSITANGDIGTGAVTAIGAQMWGAWNAAYNYGDITASASALAGEAFAYGTSSFGIYGSSLLNAGTGDITASAGVVDGDATAMGVYNVAYVYGASVTNDGSIAATASTANGNATALGVLNIAYLGYDAAATVNNGDISAIASAGSGGTSEAIGVYTSALYSGSSVDNNGSISASASGQGALATAVFAKSIYGDVVVNNTGDISASALQGAATGVYAASLYGSAEVINSDTGSILASGGSDAAGVVMYGNEVARLTNHGSIAATADLDYGSATAYGSIAAAGIGVTLNYGSIAADATVANAGTAQAIGALSYGNAATIVNEGSITATGAVGDGVATATGAYAYGEFNGIYNYGDIAASASAGNGNAYTVGVNSIGIGGTSVYNASTGGIAASADVVDGFAVAKGISNFGYFDSAYATNNGSISATATVSGSNGSSVAAAIGLENTAVLYGDAVTVNNGDISATASGGAGYSLAKGVYNFGYLYNAQLTNAGHISASASNAYGYATAFGVQSVSVYYGDASTANTGTISAIAHVDVGFADATGVDTFASYDGTVSNNGSILASATADAGLTRAMGITTYVGGAAVTQNFGDITAIATGHGEYGYALAAGASTVVAFAVNNTASMDNHGVISATATADGRRGFAAATGSSAVAKYAASSNYGSVNVVASAGYTGVAKGFGVTTSGMLSGSTVNHGSISVLASTDQGYSAAHGVVSEASQLRNANASTVNYGDIHVSAYTAGHADTGYGGFAYAWGVETYGNHYGDIHNVGSITVEADAAFGVARAVAVHLDSKRDGSTLINDGDIFARASGYTYHAVAIGADVESRGRTMGASTVNSEGASIIAVANADHGGYAGAIGSGTSVWGVDGLEAVMVNHGDIIAAASASGGDAFAKAQHTLGAFAANTFNYGSIIAESEAADGLAVAEGNKTWSFYGDAALVNAASITARADAGATGEAFAYGSMLVGPTSGSTYNGVDGTISAAAIGGGDGLALAFGSITSGGSTSVVNHGDIAASAVTVGDSDSTATGVATTGDYAAYQWAFQYFRASVYNVASSVTNEGGISATAIAELGIATATGVNAVSQHGSVTVSNAGTIVAGADGAAGSTATGLSLNASGSNSLSNDAGIHATALAADGSATASGVTAVSSGDATFANAGGITATASGATNSSAIGVSMDALGLNPITNDGGIIATAVADVGIATAMGLNVLSQYGDVTLANAGTIAAGADGAAGSTAAALSMAFAGSGIFTNDGSIDATAVADGGIASASGVNAISQNGDVTFANAGSIAAGADGAAGSTASALSLASAGGITLTNDSSITAVANGGVGSTATALSMDSVGSNTLTNTGSIVAAGTNATRIAVSSSANAAATIDNLGLISGAILTGDLDDTLTNGEGAVWNGVGQSDFGAGNNVIANAGTIKLQDATITLGSDPAALGNQFTNTGLITVSGDNTVDLGLGVFDNNGIIDFQDGTADDTLTIAGDLGGDGQLLVDVSGLHGTGDVLYVGGSVVNGSVHTIDVNLVDVPRTASSAVTVVSVAGNSTADSFALGDVRYNPANFLSLDFETSLAATINAGAAPDTFALGMEVTGLNDTGTLAASVAPGAQSLMASQVGTWRQRMGVIDKVSKGGLGLWARMFQNDGAIEPAQTASNFGQGGNFAFDQKNSGVEVGVDFAVSDQVSVGLLLAQADAKQDLNGAGVGSNKLDGDTVGAYGTWLSPTGFYVDASYRQMDFDVRINSTAGEIRGSGDADAFNLEAGYAWTLAGGLKVEPQLQYIWTQVANLDALSGALANFQSYGGNSWTGRLGVMVRRSFAAGSTVWTPYASINAVREFDGKNSYSINGDFFGATSTEGTSALVEGGLNMQAGNLSVFGGVNWQDGGALQSFGGGQLGVRYTW